MMRSLCLRLAFAMASCVALSACSGMSNWRSFYEAGNRAHSSHDQSNKEEEMYLAAIGDARTFGVPHTQYRPAQVALAKLRFNQNRLKESQKLFEELLHADEQDGNLTAQLEDLDQLGVLCTLQADYQNALPYRIQALETTNVLHGYGGAEWVRRKQQLADTQLHLNKVNEAADGLREAIAAARASRMDSNDVGTLEAQLADAQYAQGKVKDAVVAYETVLRQRFASIGSNNLLDQNTRDVLVRYVGVQHELGNDVAAKAALAKYALKLEHLGQRLGVSPFDAYLQDYDFLKRTGR